jgi:hypothetical protein
MKITNADIDRFTCGDCHIFARALHAATGWPIHTFVNDGFPDAHAFVRAPDGRCVDIEGWSTIRKFKARWGLSGCPIKEIEWANLLADWGGPEFGSHSYKRAKQLVPLILDEA